MRIVDGQRGSHVCWYDLADTCGVCFLSQQFLPLESWPTCVSFEVPWHTCESEEEAERETSLCVSPRALRRPKRPRHRSSTSVQRRVAFPSIVVTFRFAVPRFFHLSLHDHVVRRVPRSHESHLSSRSHPFHLEFEFVDATYSRLSKRHHRAAETTVLCAEARTLLLGVAWWSKRERTFMQEPLLVDRRAGTPLPNGMYTLESADLCAP